jgi:hypothetical protein
VKPPRRKRRKCERCRCTDARACVLGGLRCAWFRDDVCTACAAAFLDLPHQVVLRATWRAAVDRRQLW